MNGLDLVKVEEWRTSYPQHSHSFFKLVENTTYISKKEIIDTTITLVDKWLSERDNTKRLGVVFEEDKVGSLHWLYSLYYHKLPSHTRIVGVPVQEVVDDVDELLFVDDLSITAGSLFGLFDNLSYERRTKHISTTLILAFSYDNFQEEMSTGHIGQQYNGMKCYVGHHLKNPGFRFSGEFCTLTSGTEVGDQDDNPYPIHTEYKVANSFCAYNKFYLSCRSEPDREFMKDVESFWNTLS